MIRTVGEEIDRLETEMKELVPGLRCVAQRAQQAQQHPMRSQRSFSWGARGSPMLATS